MSYILDALKRAEKERKLGRAPTALDEVAATPVAEAGGSPLRRRLLLALLFVAAVGAGAGAVLLLRQPATPVVAATEPAPAPSPADDGTVAPDTAEVPGDNTQPGANEPAAGETEETASDDGADAKIADGDHIASLDDLTGDGAMAPKPAQPVTAAPAATPAISQIEQPATAAAKAPLTRPATAKPVPHTAVAIPRAAVPAARQPSDGSDLRSPPAGPRIVVRNFSGGPPVLPPQPTSTSVVPPPEPAPAPTQPVVSTGAPAATDAAISASPSAPTPATEPTATTAAAPAATTLNVAPATVSEPPPAELLPKPRRSARTVASLQDEAPVTMAARPAQRSGGPRIATPGIDAIKKLKEMPPTYRAEFPPISIDVHAYTDDPARSFVILGGKRYKAGDNLAEGPHIADIVPEGIIFDWRGERVLVGLPH